MTAAMTPWFEGTVKPLRSRPGVYQTYLWIHGYTVSGYSYWTGRRWSPMRISVDRAYLDVGCSTRGALQNPKWCGLASDPNEDLGRAVARIRKAVAAKGGYGEGA